MFKCLLEEMTNEKYEMATIFIKKKFLELKTKILSNFKEGFLKKDVIILNVSMAWCRTFYRIVRSTSWWMKFRIITTCKPLRSLTPCRRLKNKWFQSRFKTISFCLGEGSSLPSALLSMAIKKMDIRLASSSRNTTISSRGDSSPLSSKRLYIFHK